MGEVQCIVSSYREKLLPSLYELQCKNSLCDVEIITKTGTVHVHKVILAVCGSPILLESVNIADKIAILGKTKINCNDYSKEVVEALIKYLYTGEIKVKESNAKDFTKLCQTFKLTYVLDEFINCVIRQNILKSSDQNLEQEQPLSTCSNLSTLSEAAHTISSMDLVESSKPVKTPNKKDKHNTPNRKIKSEKSDESLSKKEEVNIPPSSIGDDDEATQDLVEYESLIKGKRSAQQAIIKVDNAQEGYDPKKDSINQNDNSNINMFLMSPEHNPYFETPDTSYVKRPRIRTKAPTTTKSKPSPKTKTKPNGRKSKLGTIKVKIKKTKKYNKTTEETITEKVPQKTPKRKRGIIHRWCRKCDVRLPEKDLRKHMRTKHPPYSCKLCEWTGLLKRELALHMYNKHQMLIMPDIYPLLQCDHEGCTFKTLISYALDRHKECHNRLVRHLCDVCGSSFATAGGLKEHSLRHADENPIYKCQICDAVFGWKCKLKSHEMKEHGTYLLCEFCTYKTKYKDKLTMHLHHEHDQPLPSNQKIHRCDQCDYYCINRSKLRFHKIRHTGEKNFTCHQCGKSYLNQHTMKNHINSTHGARTFSCHLCNYASKRKSELNNHIKSRHSDDRPFTCNMCDYACKLRGNLHKHIRQVHKVEVVTRNQLHQSMLETGKGYTQLLDARRKDEILIQEKSDTLLPEKQSTIPEPNIIPLPVTNVDNYQERFLEHCVPSKTVNESLLPRNIEMLAREHSVAVITERSAETFSTPIGSSVFHSINNATFHSTDSDSYS